MYSVMRFVLFVAVPVSAGSSKHAPLTLITQTNKTDTDSNRHQSTYRTYTCMQLELQLIIIVMIDDSSADYFLN